MFIKKILSFSLLLAIFNSFAIASADLQVLDYFDQPIKDVSVLIYNNKKLVNKKVLTGADGRIPKKALAVTFQTLVLSHPDFIKKTILNVAKKNNLSTIYLNKKITNANTLKGKTFNFAGVKRDGFVDFGLSLLSLNQSEIWNINPVYFFSTKLVPVPSFSRLKVPDNLSLPNQKERYFISIHLKKESYTLDIPKKKKYKIHTLHGQFPLKAAISKIRSGASFISLINLFKFKAYSSLNKDFKKTAEGTEANFDLSKNTIDSKIKVQTTVNLLKNEILMLSLKKDQKQYSPFDIKQLEGKEGTLAMPTNTLQSFVIGLLTKKQDDPECTEDCTLAKLTFQERQFLQSIGVNIQKADPLDLVFLSYMLFNNSKNFFKLKIQSNFLSAYQISIALQTVADKNVTLKFLPLIKPPVINKDTVSLVLPKLKSSFKAHSSLLQLVEVETVFIDKKKKHKLIKTTVLTQVAVSGWQNQFSMDFFNQFKKDPAKTYAVQIIFLANQSANSLPTHATRSLSKITN